MWPSCLVLGGIVDPETSEAKCAAWLVGGDCREREAGTGLVLGDTATHRVVPTWLGKWVEPGGL